MSVRVYKTASEEDTIELGRKLATEIQRPSLVLLTGNLGAGKTTLSKGIVAGLNAAGVDEVSSPTYTVIHEYGSNVYHIDLYRLDRPEQVSALGLDEMFDRGAVMLVEWGEAYKQALPSNTLIEIGIERGPDDERTFTVAGLD
ncbi:MAG TPA: tRNA (adenosine(37)-N6)-threonylcarbamoyltransferase complex ATPase subunit type 1 TsaE [Bryobacteraceae bacterium]|nr:tRNA (adenosine(37)-N6)-threonylcarbamoyltransferase complex ATPase subunit type 1 TsaE [Bryobacteraceae bacterium]